MSVLRLVGLVGIILGVGVGVETIALLSMGHFIGYAQGYLDAQKTAAPKWRALTPDELSVGKCLHRDADGQYSWQKCEVEP